MVPASFRVIQGSKGAKWRTGGSTPTPKGDTGGSRERVRYVFCRKGCGVKEVANAMLGKLLRAIAIVPIIRAAPQTPPKPART